MARKWLQSASVEVSDKGELSVSIAAIDAVMGSEIVVTLGANAVPLSGGSIPCVGAFIRAPHETADGFKLTAPVLVGKHATAPKAMLLAVDNYAGLFYPVDDLANAHAKGTNGEQVIVTPLVARS
jgi:hypothetical protein